MIHDNIRMNAEGSMEYAHMMTYFHEASDEMLNTERTTVLICPGGGYCMTSAREGEPVAVEFYNKGFNAAVLWYSVAPARFPVSLNEAGLAMQYLYDNAAKYGINRDKLIIMGFSAGGHLAASYACFWKKYGFVRPSGAILAYPVITSGEFAHEDSFRKLLGDKYDAMKSELSLEFKVNADNPKTFLWTTFEDNCVPAENSMLFAAALRQFGIPTELHMFEKGSHGLSLADERTKNPQYPDSVQPECVPWMGLCLTWASEI